MDWQDLAGRVFVYFFTERNCSAETAAKKTLEAVMAYETVIAQLTIEEEPDVAGTGTDSSDQG